MKCFWHWVDIVDAYGADFYVVCDDEELSRAVFEKRKCKIITSNRRIFLDISEVFDNKNVGYALLTPFVHSKEHNFPSFWNIDADDTMFLPGSEYCAEVLKQAGDYADAHGIDCFSLDMWYSRLNGKHWSFGVCYTAMNADYQAVLHNSVGIFRRLSVSEPERVFHKNIDEHFNNLRLESILKLETFYIDNLIFFHDCVFNTWRDGKLKFDLFTVEAPFRRRIFWNNSNPILAAIPIPPDAVKIEMRGGGKKYLLLRSAVWIRWFVKSVFRTLAGKNREVFKK
jgi:hypothetical protein